MAFLQTANQAPLNQSDLVLRTRLDAHFPEISTNRLTVIQAPAGYGKTSLLTQWCKALTFLNYDTLWLTVSSSETSATELLSHIAGALQFELELGSRTRNNRNNEMFESRDSLITHIAQALAKRTEPLYICIDDLHLLAPAPQSALCQLIELATPLVHFLVTSRRTPDLHLSRVRAQGQLKEISSEELRFREDEIASLLDPKLAFSTADIKLLEEKTEGWAAGIKLLCLSAKTETIPPRDLLNKLTGSKRSIADFFGDEVIRSQHEETQKFLIFTSFLEYFSPELCEAITGKPNCAKILSEIETSGLFLQLLDDERRLYRYHHLFSDFLQQQLHDQYADHIPTLYKRASDFYCQVGDHDNAIDYALKGGNPVQALELLEHRCQDMTYTGKFRLVNKFVAQIPPSILKRYPRVQLTLAWLATRNLRFNETRELLNNVKNILKHQENSQNTSPEELKKLRYLLAHREMVLAAAHDQHAQVETLCNSLLEQYPEENHPYLCGTIYGHLMDSRREQYKLNDIEHLQSMAQGILMRSTYTFASIALQASIGPSLFFIGKTNSARRALEQGLAEGIRFGGLNSSLSALPALPLAEILYQENHLERAADLVNATLPYVTEFAFTDQLRSGFLTRSRICAAKSDLDGAFQALEEGISIATERKLERLRVALSAELIKLYIQIGKAEQAKRYAREGALLPCAKNVTPHSLSTTVDELRAQISIRILLIDGDTKEASRIAKLWRRHTLSAGALQSRVSWELLISQILFISGDERAALRMLRDAMNIAIDTRQIRQFIDEGSIIRTILTNYNRANELALHNPTDAFAAHLLEIFNDNIGQEKLKIEPVSQNCLNGNLTAREKEILNLIGSGMRNSEVAQRLGITEGSVKWYMQQIYDKVGTRRRMQAVERARQLGLIA